MIGDMMVLEVIYIWMNDRDCNIEIKWIDYYVLVYERYSNVRVDYKNPNVRYWTDDYMVQFSSIQHLLI